MTAAQERLSYVVPSPAARHLACQIPVETAPPQPVQSWPVLARVRSGEQLTGIFYGLLEPGTIFHYQWGLSAFADNRLAPRFVTGNLVDEESRKRDFAEGNRLTGKRRYGKDLSNAARTLIWAGFSSSPWMHTISGLVFARRALRG
jgi:hypothetical protein